MANSFKVIDMVTDEALRIAHETGAFIMTVDRQYDSSFKDNGKGRIGSVLRVREPNRYTVTEGSRVMDVQDQTETTQTITLATQSHVDMRFNSSELLLSVNSDGAFDDLSKHYIEPAVKQLISVIEGNFLAFATRATNNVAGTAGTPITSLVVPGSARAKLNQGLAPKDDNRCIQMDSVAMGSVVNGVAAYFNPTNAIGKQYTEGLVARTSMANWYENERILSVTNSSDVTGSTNASALVTDGGNTLAMFTDVVSPAEGSVFTVTGIFACHPETKAAYPHLQQYVVAVTSAGAAITISPRTFLTGPKKNVSSSTGADLTPTSFNSKVLTFVGAASTTYPQQLMYHKEAFQFVTGDLPIMDSAQKCVRKMEERLSMRVWMDGDIRNDELLMRIDILHGFAALRPEWACRLIGAAAA